MPVSVVMPALEMAQETGKLLRWLKHEGEQVAKGDMLIEIETDKAVVEIEAAADGVLAGVTAKPDEVIPVGQTIAWLLQPGETVPTRNAPTQTGRTGAAASAVVGQTLSGVPAEPQATRPDPERRPRVSPKARKMAAELGVDLNRVVGSGPGGEILADDISAAAAAPSSNAEAITTAGRLMAERTTASWTSVPHFFVTRDVDASALSAARERLLDGIEQSHGVRITHTDLLVAAVARALRAHPRMNGSWSDGGIVLNPEVNVALAIAVDNAVVTGVIKDADRADLATIALRRRELAERAKSNRLQPADITGGTFTVSNLGMLGVDAFTAIIVPPQAGILAVGAITDRVVAHEGRVAIRPYMTMTLSSDHRVVDGARAAAFLVDVVAGVQQPAELQ